MKNILIVFSIFLSTLAGKSQAPKLGEIVYMMVPVADTASIGANVISGIVTKRSLNGKLDVLSFFGSAQVSHVDLPHYTDWNANLTENNGIYYWLTRAEATELSILQNTTDKFIGLNPPIDNTDYTKWFIDGEWKAEPLPEAVTVGDTSSMLDGYARKSSVYTKAQSDGRYLQSFTESDPNVPAYSKSLNAFSVIKASTDALYRPISYVPAWGDVTGKPTFATVATSGSYNDLSNKPTIPTVSGSTGSFGFVTTSNGLVTSGKRLELYSGSTNASGNYAVTFGTAYSVAPNIQASITNQSNVNWFIRVSAVSTTGFTINVFSRSSVTSLPILGVLTDALLGSATTNVNGATVDVLVTEK